MSGFVPQLPAMTLRRVQAKLYISHQISGVSNNRIWSLTATTPAHPATYRNIATGVVRVKRLKRETNKLCLWYPGSKNIRFIATLLCISRTY